MALQVRGLPRFRGSFELKDEPGLERFVAEISEENPSIYDDLEFTIREADAYLRSRGVKYRGTAEESVDYEDPDDRSVHFKIMIDGFPIPEKSKVVRDMVAHMCVKNDDYLRNIVIGAR